MLELPSNERLEVGVDEAGRGPLAFEVVSAAVVMPSKYNMVDDMVGLIKDSKKLGEKKRVTLCEYIKKTAIAYGIGIATVEEIDKHNILNATFIAMHRALDQVYEKKVFDHIMVDGDKFKPYIPPRLDSSWLPYTCIVDGDDHMLNIAAASILAKEYRDNIVKQAVLNNPQLDERYGFKSNKGYGTKKHMQGLELYGACDYHRKSFAPVRRVLDVEFVP